MGGDCCSRAGTGESAQDRGGRCTALGMLAGARWVSDHGKRCVDGMESIASGVGCDPVDGWHGHWSAARHQMELALGGTTHSLDH